MSDGRVVIDSIWNDAPVQKGLKDLQKSMQRTGDQLVKMGKSLTTKVTAPIVGAFGVAVKGAADLEGAMSKFNVVFAGMEDEMYKWVDTFRSEFPLARREIIKMSADLQDLLVPMGVNRKDAARMTQEWFHLAGALSAFNDVPIDQALEAIRSGIAGQTQPLRQFGINASVAALKQTALAHGLMEAGDEMTDQVRQQALLIQAYEQSADALNGLEEQKGSLLWKMQELWATIKDLGDSFGQILLPYVSRAVDFIQDLVERFVQLDERAQKMIVILALVAAAIGPVLIVAGMLAKGIAALGGVFSLAGLKIMLIIGIFALIGAAIMTLWNENEEFREAVIAIWESIKEWAMNIWGAIRDFWEENGEAIIAKAKEIWQDIQEIFMVLFRVLKDIWDSLSETFMHVWKLIQKFWEAWGDTILSVAQTMWNQIKMVIETVINVIKDVIGLVMAIIRGDWSEAWNRIKSIVTSIVNLIKNTISNWINIIRSIVTNGFNIIRNGIQNAMQSARNGVSNAINGIRTAISNGINGALNVVKNLGRSFFDAGKGLIQQMINGIKNMAAGVKNAVTNVVSSVRNLLPFSPAKEGPLSDLDKLDFGGPIATSIEADTKNIQHKMQSMLALPDMPTQNTVNHGGEITMRIEGVNDRGEFIDAVQVLMEAVSDPRGLRVLNQGMALAAQKATGGLG